MTPHELERIRKELTELRQEFASMAQRIAKLENTLDQLSSPAVIDVEHDIPEANPLAPVLETTVKTTAKTAPQDPQNAQEPDLEFHIGGTWLNRIGVVALILGLALFLKFSFDKQWIGPTTRILLGILAGLTMLFLGEKLRPRYLKYAAGLLGGGSLALFFSVFAAYQFYHLIAPVFAFLFLVIVMAYTVFMAVRHRSLPIGILGIIGGYAAPFLIHADQSSLWTLFSYLTLLTAGVLAVSIYKKWPVFQYLSFLFNQFIFAFVWFVSMWGGMAGNLAPFFSYAIALFVLYLGVATVYNIRTQKKATLWDSGLITLNAFAFFLWSTTLLEETVFRDYPGYYAVLLALLYIYLGRFAHRLMREDKSQVYSLFGVAFVLITLAVRLQISEFYIGLAWLFESIALIFIAQKLASRPMAYSGLAVLGLGLLVTALYLIDLTGSRTFFFNAPTLLLFASLAAVFAATRLLRNMPLKREIGIALQGLLLVLIFAGLSAENHHFFQLLPIQSFLSPEQLSLSGLWLIYAVSLFLYGMYKDNRYYRYAALGLLGMIVVKAFFVDLSKLATLFKILLFLVLGFALLGISYLYQKKKASLAGKEEHL